MLWWSWINPNILHLGVKRRGLDRVTNCHHRQLKSLGVVVVIHDEFKSQACLTIHHTYNETLKGLRCCELPKSVQTQSILVWKVDKGQANFATMTENHVVVTVSHPIYQSQLSPTIHYTHIENLEGLRCCESLESIQTYSILVWNAGAWRVKCHHRQLKSWGVVVVYMMNSNLKLV